MLRTSDLEYDLPSGRIATHPAQPRDSARLMVVDRARGVVEHRIVRDLPELLRRGDLLVTNASRVLPARFVGVRDDTGGGVEGLYLREGPRAGTWVVMLRARRFKPGMRVRLVGSGGHDGGVHGGVVLTLTEDAVGEGGARIVEVSGAGAEGMSTPAILERVGLPPIPPYILSARRAEQGDEPRGGAVREGGARACRGEVGAGGDVGSYQTVFAGELLASADGSECGSVAAPTAGLHFTPELMGRLAAAGVERAEVVLHVGPGTFKPVEAEFVQDHAMHAEWCTRPAATREAMERARTGGGRVVCVGTTSARTVEAFARLEVEKGAPGDRNRPQACATGEWLHTRLLITPGFAWRGTGALLTNFHLPRSTLMALVAAMLPGGVAELKGLYARAIADGYRFYSYGDAMLVI